MTWEAKPTGKRGRQPTSSDAANQTCLTMKVLFGMALRQTTGFVESLLRLSGLDWSALDFSTVSRQQKTLAVNIPHRGSQGPLHLLIDSTVIKVEGEGERSSSPTGFGGAIFGFGASTLEIAVGTKLATIWTTKFRTMGRRFQSLSDSAGTARQTGLRRMSAVVNGTVIV